jgi:MFS family permease
MKRVLFMTALVIAGEAIFGLPFVVARVFRPTLLEVSNITNLPLGTAFSIYGIVAMIAYFPGGPLADRYPARRLISAALVSTACGGLVYASLPSVGLLQVLFGFGGLTTILLLWAAMTRATRQWGGEQSQGRAFGILDGGRDLFSAVLSTFTVGLFGPLIPDDPDTATRAQKADALRQVILIFTAMTVVAATIISRFVLNGRVDSSAKQERPRVGLPQIA